MTLPLPPRVAGPIYESKPTQAPAPGVYVQNVLKGSAVTVYAQPHGASNPVAVSAPTSAATDVGVWVTLTGSLASNTKVTAVQVNSGQESGPSNQVLVQPVPKPPPRPEFLSPLSACMSALRMGNLIPGAILHITNAEGTVVEKPVTEAVDGVQVFALSTGVHTDPNTMLTARQTYNGTPSHPATSPIISSRLPLTTPRIAPVWPCETGLFLSNLTPGSNLKITNDGNESDFANTYEALDPLLLVAPLKAGTEVTVEQHYSRCSATASHTATAHVSPTPKPLPHLSVGYAPGTGQSLLVSNVLPGETLSVYADVAGTPPHLLGEQSVSYVPATVNLPSYPGANSPDGPPVSLNVKATMCDNQDAHTPVSPAQPPQGLGGFNQYVFSSPDPRTEGRTGIPLRGLKVKIEITKPLVLEENSPPLGFQINGVSANTSRPARPASVDFQQFGLQMDPTSFKVQSFAENWPVALNTNSNANNLFNELSVNSLETHIGSTMPTWTFLFELDYQPDNSPLIKGFTCSVTDQGQHVGSLPIKILGLPLVSQYISEFGLPPNHTKVEDGDLGSFIAFQVVIVAYSSAAGKGATLVDGAGKITCTADSPLTPSIPWPPFADGNGATAEESNAVYSLVDAAPSTSIVQSFGVPA